MRYRQDTANSASAETETIRAITRPSRNASPSQLPRIPLSVDSEAQQPFATQPLPAAQPCGPLGCCNELAAFLQQVGPLLRNNARGWAGTHHTTLLLLTHTPSCRRPCLSCRQAWPRKDGPGMQRW